MSRSRRAFTMLEIITVMVLIIILAGIATVGVRSFLNGTSDTTAHATIERVLTAERAFANSFGGYTNHPDDLVDLGRDVELVRVDGPAGRTRASESTGEDVASLAVSESGILGIAVKSASGECLLVTAAPLYAGFAEAGSGDLDAAGKYSAAPAGASCNGAEALPAGESIARDQKLRPTP